MNIPEEQVIAVDENDAIVGYFEKLKAHEEGILHRAVSVFIFDPAKRLLLQQRATGKYHSAALWTNTCCSHPRPGETIQDAAHRRLYEEMGILCPLNPVFAFQYRTEFNNGLIENEYDHVFAGLWDGIPVPNENEVQDWKWLSEQEISQELKREPESFTYWFTKIYDRVFAEFAKQQEK